MRFLVDTSVWSDALRRKSSSISASTTILSRLIINESEIVIIGIVLQEILSGITNQKLFYEINTILSNFPYIEIKKEDYIFAAELRNILKSKGITAGAFDFLIASVAIKNNLTLVTTDNDFKYIAKHSDLKLLDFDQITGNVS